MAYDVSLARGQFPGVSSDFVMADNAGGTQVPFQVADAVRSYLLESNTQPTGPYSLSKSSAEVISRARGVAAQMIGAEANEIVFGANMSMLLRSLAVALSELWDPDDEIIVCQAEHEANFGCWEFLEQFGIKLRIWEIDADHAEFDVASLVDLVNDKTRLIAVHHTSNVLGNIMPIHEVARLTQGSDIYLCVDGGQYVPHRMADVKAMGADFYVFSAYKSYGPHVGVMYGRREVLEEIPGWNHFWVENDAVPEKFELGTGNYEGMAGLVGLEKYYRSLAMSMDAPLREAMESVFAGIQEHETKLTADLLNFLTDHPRVHIVGNDARMMETRMPIVSFMVDDVDPHELASRMAEEGVAVRAGHFNAPRLLDALGLLEYNGVVRISLAHYNNKTEIDKIKKVIRPHIS